MFKVGDLIQYTKTWDGSRNGYYGEVHIVLDVHYFHGKPFMDTYNLSRGKYWTSVGDVEYFSLYEKSDIL